MATPHHRSETRRQRRRRDLLDLPRKGFAVAVVLLVAAGSLLLGPWVVFGRQPALMIAGGVLSVAAGVIFLMAVRAMTDRWKE